MKSLLTSSIKFLIIAATLATWLLINAADARAQRRLQVNISTAPNGLTVTGSDLIGIYTLASFGNVNGLGIGTLPTGVTKTIKATGTYYTTPITIRPVFSGFNTNERAYIYVYSDTVGTAAGRTALREGGTEAGLIAAVAAPAAFNLAIPPIAGPLASNATITRYVGFFVSNANGAAAVNGTLTASLIYGIYVN